MTSDEGGDTSGMAVQGATRGVGRASVAGAAVERFGPELAQGVVVLLWSSTFVITKAAFGAIGPLAFTFVRFALLPLLAFGVLFARRRGAERTVRRADLPRFALAGLCGYALYQLGFALGLSRTSPFSSALLIAMTPLLTVVLLALGGERTSPRGWLGLAIAIAGAIIFLAEKRGGGAGSLVGDLLSLGAALSFAIYGIVARPLVRRYPPETYTAYTVLAGSIPLLIISAPTARATDWTAVPWPVWLGILHMVVLTVYVAYMLWNWAIARRGVAAASSFGLLVPVLSGLLSALFFAEGFGPQKLLGAALVLAGLVVIRAPRRADADDCAE